jgi:hypothetical protein
MIKIPTRSVAIATMALSVGLLVSLPLRALPATGDDSSSADVKVAQELVRNPFSGTFAGGSNSPALNGLFANPNVSIAGSSGNTPTFSGGGGGGFIPPVLGGGGGFIPTFGSAGNGGGSNAGGAQGGGSTIPITTSNVPGPNVYLPPAAGNGGNSGSTNGASYSAPAAAVESVPDTGTTAILLGSALLGLVAFARRWKR